MNEELNLHIQKLQSRAILFLLALLLGIVSLALGLIAAFASSLSAIIFFVATVLCIIILIRSHRMAKQEASENSHKPVVVKADRNLSFPEIVRSFEAVTDAHKQLSPSGQVRFFLLEQDFRLRAILYQTEYFCKSEFDHAKKLTNRKANDTLHIPSRVGHFEAAKMMRLNIIYTEVLNDSLYRLLSQNALRNLTRAEGIMNIAVVGDQIILPPLYGMCHLLEVGRYRGILRFITQVLVNITAQ